MEPEQTKVEKDMLNWNLDPQGFVSHYMVSGPRVEPFSSPVRDANLLRFESGLRAGIASHEPLEHPERISAGEASRLGMPWRFQGGRDTSLVNLSDFYSTMQRVRFDAATVLISQREEDCAAVLWSYAAVDLYCNGQRAGGLDRPVYKPIQRRELTLHLRKGRNVIYLACETLGVRDTRSVVGLQIRNGEGRIQVSLPDEWMAEEAGAALDFLEDVRLAGDELRFDVPAPLGAEWAWNVDRMDLAHAEDPMEWQKIPAGREALALDSEKAYLTLRVPAGGDYLTRAVERTEKLRPRITDPVPARETDEVPRTGAQREEGGFPSPHSNEGTEYQNPKTELREEREEEHLRVILRRVAGISSFNRGDGFGFPIANLLARQYLGCPAPEDDQLFEDMLDLIQRRVDCADFLVCGLIRYLKNYPISESQEARVRQVLTGWRYWMDQDGFDGMCFWSENHCLMFYASAMQAGERYPEDFFPLAGRTGRELQQWGRAMVMDWLADVEEYGFEEFHSTVYMCVTLAALLNVIDYAEEEISRRAAAVTDRMLNLLAAHTFRGGIIAPQGRVYRGALYPFSAGAMALMNLADPSQPWDIGEGWLSFYATSRYRFPEGMKEKMDAEQSMDYLSGNAEILLEKHADWCLTSVRIPGEASRRWENIARRPGVNPSTHAFVKSFNECFHGTTCFQPGVYGYQQHLWYAALDGEAVIFLNHPGSTSEGGDLRPGYWHGNGVFPALKQEGNRLGMIYRIPESHPIHYIHLYCPECRFEEIRREGSWLFLRKGQGYIGLWSSAEMTPWDGMNFGCEQRMRGSETACFCVCGGREFENLDAFAAHAKEQHPAYDPEKRTLTAEGYALTWTQGQDDTQYL